MDQVQTSGLNELISQKESIQGLLTTIRYHPNFIFYVLSEKDKQDREQNEVEKVYRWTFFEIKKVKLHGGKDN